MIWVSTNGDWCVAWGSPCRGDSVRFDGSRDTVVLKAPMSLTSIWSSKKYWNHSSKRPTCSGTDAMAAKVGCVRQTTSASLYANATADASASQATQSGATSASPTPSHVFQEYMRIACPFRCPAHMQETRTVADCRTQQ